MKPDKLVIDSFHPSIAAYGFNKLGFKTPSSSQSLPAGGMLHFISLEDVDINLEDFDGIIIPQGVFETISTRQHYFEVSTQVNCYKDLLLERERQLINVVTQGEWVCFLVGEIIDQVPQGHGLQSIEDTDLCKRMLNSLKVERHPVSGITAVEATQSEFDKFIKRYGVAKTLLNLPYGNKVENRILAKVGQRAVGLEFLNKIFFLPFHTTKRDEDTALEVATWLLNAIADYRQKHSAPLPEWLNEFRFSQEDALAVTLQSAIEKVNQLNGNLQTWRGYKSILTTSADTLKNNLVLILESFFSLKIDSTDEYKEDGKILDDAGGLIAVFEVKGTKKGVTREFINQVDSHRERNKLPSSMPGILFLNNEMDVDGITARFETQVNGDQILHAVKLGVTIVRTIDLLFLMKHLETNPNKKDEILKLFQQGGGWLRSGPEGYELIKK